jgi:E3 ubiquitin-protein ligase RNF14|eukprot:COSAG06_NODE_5413_length_3499_cov_12.740588_5_plen_64_part_00
MTCGNCGCFFCWRCNRAVDGYDHFGSGSCVLFEQAEITAWYDLINLGLTLRNGNAPHRWLLCD